MLSFHYNIIEQADQAGWYGSDMFSCDCLHPVWLYSCPTCTRSVPLHAVQGIIDSGPGQMRENEVFVIVLSSCADSFAFNAGLTDNSKIAFSHQGSIYTAGWFLTGSCFAHVSFETIAGMSPHTLSTFPFLARCCQFGPGSSNLCFWVSFLMGSVSSNCPDVMEEDLQSKLQEFMKRDPGWRCWVEISAGGKKRRETTPLKVWKLHGIGWRGDWQVVNGEKTSGGALKSWQLNYCEAVLSCIILGLSARFLMYFCWFKKI